MKYNSLWFLDSELKDDRGHYANFAEKIVEEACGQNLETVVAGNRTVSDSLEQRLGARKAFHGMMHSFVPLGKVSALLNPLIGSHVYYRELRRLLPENGQSAIAFAATANHRHFPALAKWLLTFPIAAAPVLFIYLRFHFHDPVSNRPLPTAPLVRRGLKLLERTARSHRVILICDSEQLAHEYRRVTSLPIEVLPLPHMIPAQILATQEDKNGQSICFSYLGEARVEKGYDLLVEATQRLQRMPEWRDVRMKVHSYHHPRYRMENWTRQLTGVPKVECISEPMNLKSYYKMLLESDVILMPYRRSTYFARSSGIFVDALAAGKPVIATQGTWMSEQLKHFGAGMLCRDKDSADLARAMIETRESLPELKQRASAGKHAWVDGHNAKLFLTSLLRIAEAS